MALFPPLTEPRYEELKFTWTEQLSRGMSYSDMSRSHRGADVAGEKGLAAGPSSQEKHVSMYWLVRRSVLQAHPERIFMSLSSSDHAVSTACEMKLLVSLVCGVTRSIVTSLTPSEMMRFGIGV